MLVKLGLVIAIQQSSKSSHIESQIKFPYTVQVSRFVSPREAGADDGPRCYESAFLRCAACPAGCGRPRGQGGQKLAMAPDAMGA